MTEYGPIVHAFLPIFFKRWAELMVESWPPNVFDPIEWYEKPL